MGLKRLLIIIVTVFIAACSEDDEKVEEGLSAYDLDVIVYFKEIALGFEFGGASEITRKWGGNMQVFVGGNSGSELLTELDDIITEINSLATDGFAVERVSDSAQSNFYVFFGEGEDYAAIYPSQADLVENNFGLFHVNWNASNEINTGYMYVDTERANIAEQKHLLREELTQSLGLAKDSPMYQESIFQSAWTTTQEYAQVDEDVIRLLYHPDVSTGLNATQVEEALRKILLEEK